MVVPSNRQSGTVVVNRKEVRFQTFLKSCRGIEFSCGQPIHENYCVALYCNYSVLFYLLELFDRKSNSIDSA